MSYFLKVSQGDNGREMVFGEHESMLVPQNIMLTFVPNPIGWGTYTSNPGIHFFICEFVDLTDDIPEINAFIKTLAEPQMLGSQLVRNAFLLVEYYS